MEFLERGLVWALVLGMNDEDDTISDLAFPTLFILGEFGVNVSRDRFYLEAFNSHLALRKACMRMSTTHFPNN